MEKHISKDVDEEGIADSDDLQHVSDNQKDVSSIRMANMFPDCVGGVDVVSDAENIKNLFKVPYNENHLSMMVHRVGNTLLLDNFDMHKYLSHTSETEDEPEWNTRLRKFILETVKQDNEDPNLHMENVTICDENALKQKGLVSKFLSLSLEPEKENAETDRKIEKSLPPPILPEQAAVSVSSETTTSHGRNVIWTFENIEMLIGTDLPIFGGGTHPCISLRLRDVSKPITVLTGIDYWLDNLMSNVPEVKMCCHLNGIVQKYEIVKTEDLPRLDNSKFSPKLIRDVAQNILSFLKFNATKAGHTYWLFKNVGHNEEIVKLYDLSSLCSRKTIENEHTPFTIPVAMLLYRVAHSIKHSFDRSDDPAQPGCSVKSHDRQPSTIRMLLKNCIKLLPVEKYPEIVSSAHYMLADLYIPAKTYAEAPVFEQKEENCPDYFNNSDTEDDDEDSATKTLILEQGGACDKFISYRRNAPPALSGTIEERCVQALQSIAQGLNCIQYFSNADGIPMGQSKLTKGEIDGKQNEKNTKKKRATSEDDEDSNNLLRSNNQGARTLPIWQEKNGSGDDSWKDHLKMLLYEKAVLVYATLMENYFRLERYGSSFRTAGLLARCQLVLNRLPFASNALKENCLLGRAGACCVMMVKNCSEITSHMEQLHQSNSDEDLKMIEQLENEEGFYNIRIRQSNMRSVFFCDLGTTERILLKGVECYDTSLKLRENDSLLPRLGNSLNAMASFYLTNAKTAADPKEMMRMCKKAQPYLQRGLVVFERLEDDTYICLFHANTGNLHQMLAHAATPLNRGELTQVERTNYDKAVESYEKALNALSEEKRCLSIWDEVQFGLATSLFNMGSIMYDHPPRSSKKLDAEKRVIAIFRRALHHLVFNKNNPEFPEYLALALKIHTRIGSICYRHIITNDTDEVSRNNMIQLAKINYEKQSILFLLAQDLCNYFTSQLKRITVGLRLVHGNTVPNVEVLHGEHEEALKVCLEMDSMLKLMISEKVEMPETELESVAEDGALTEGTTKTLSLNSLLNLFKKRLQHVLKMLIKLCTTKPLPDKDCAKLSQMYKSCYVSTFVLKDGLPCIELVPKLHNVLEQIKENLARLSE